MKNEDGARFLLARNMKRLRKVLGLSQMAMAEKVGCSTTLIGNIETCKRFPSADNLDRISAALEVPLFELFRRDSPAIEARVSQARLRERIEDEVRSAIRKVFVEETGSPSPNA